MLNVLCKNKSMHIFFGTFISMQLSSYMGYHIKVCVVDEMKILYQEFLY